MPLDLPSFFRRARACLEQSLYFILWRQKLIQSAYACSSILVSGVVLWLLAETSLDCNYVGFFQTVLLPSLIGSEVFWQFLSARLTDSTPRHAKTILLVTSISQIVLDLIAFFFLKYSRWLVAIWFIFRFAAQQQVGNSAGKILKMRIEWVLQVPQEKQLSYFNTVIVSGELIGRASAVLFVYLIGVSLGKNGYSFNSIKNLFLLVLVFWDLVCFICTFAIPESYFLPNEKYLMNSPDSADFQYDKVPLIEHQGDSFDGNDGLTGSKDNLENIMPSEQELDNVLGPKIQIGEPEANVHPIKVFINYFKTSAIKFWNDGPTFFSVVHFWTAFMLVSIVNIVLKFEVSEVGTSPTTPTRSNLCSGQLVNVLQVGVSENVATLVGVLAYNFGLTRVRPYLFYSRIFVAISAGFAGLFLSIAWKDSLGSVGGSIVLGALYVGLYLVQTYDGNVAAAWSDPTIIAFIFAMQASFAQVLALVPILIAAIGIPNGGVIGICVAVSLIFAIATFFYSKRKRRDILLREIEESSTEADMIAAEESFTSAAPLENIISPEDLEE